MQAEIDGNFTLNELELAILNKEAAGNELTALDNNAKTQDPLTLATFKQLSPGKRPAPLQLVKGKGKSRAGATLICSGTVFITGKKATVSAFRLE